jgi:hypothetical protein
MASFAATAAVRKSYPSRHRGAKGTLASTPRAVEHRTMRNANLGVRFLLELALLGALADGAASLAEGSAGIGLALFAVVDAATVWGLFVSPRAKYLAPEPLRWAIEASLFAAGGAGLWLAGRPLLGVALVVAGLVSGALTRRLGGNWLDEGAR